MSEMVTWRDLLSFVGLILLMVQNISLIQWGNTERQVVCQEEHGHWLIVENLTYRYSLSVDVNNTEIIYDEGELLTEQEYKKLCP